jgi:glycosyl transferase family 87
VTAGRPRLSPRFVAAASVIAAIGFVLTFYWVVWLVGRYFYVPYSSDGDVPLFQQYADRIFGGHLPYRDFVLLYPPGALPAFVVPAWLAGTSVNADRYRVAFQGLMVVCGAIMTILSVVTLSRVTDRRRDILLGGALLVAAPAVLGWTIVLRYDLWPAVLTAATMLCVVVARYRIGAIFLGLAILAKVYPIVLLPLLAAYAWRNAGRREAALFVGITAGVIALVFAPFLLYDGFGFLKGLLAAFDRSLQVESLGAAILFVLHAVAGEHITVQFGGGSHNLVGRLPDLAINIQMYATGVLLLILWIRFARGPADARTLVLASAGAVAIYVGLGRVLSDQYVIWLIPLVAMVPWSAARLAGPGLIAILALSNWIYPGEYAAFERDFVPGPAWVVLFRVVAILMLGLYLGRRAAAPADPGEELSSPPLEPAPESPTEGEASLAGP